MPTAGSWVVVFYYERGNPVRPFERVNIAHTRQSRPDYGLDDQVNILKAFYGVETFLTF